MRRSIAFALLLLAGLVACDGEEPGEEEGSPAVVESPSGPTEDSGPTEGESPSASPGSEELPSPVAAFDQGGAYFGVYLAAAPFDTPELQDAVDRLAALGIDAFPGSLACDQGAAEQLRVDRDLAAVAVYFERRRDAVAFANALDPPPVGIALVRTFCAD
ncbi:MAG: hypothetical protein ACRDHU_06050 [Actinomycetota bacterium]